MVSPVRFFLSMVVKYFLATTTSSGTVMLIYLTKDGFKYTYFFTFFVKMSIYQTDFAIFC